MNVISFPGTYMPAKRTGKRTTLNKAGDSQAHKPLTDARLRQLARQIGKAARDAEEVADRGEDRPLSKLASLFREESRKAEEERNARYGRWLSGDVSPLSTYYQASQRGIATDHFGHGPDEFRWAIESVPRGDVLNARMTREALALAIDQLNALAVLVRWGGLTPGIPSNRDDQQARDIPYHVISDLAVVLTRLKAFGGAPFPSEGELRYAERAKAEFDSEI